jgi:hypothetical protein
LYGIGSGICGRTATDVNDTASFSQKSIGEAVDTELRYVARLFGPAIVIVPEGLENLFSRLDKLENAHRQNASNGGASSTTSVQENSRIEVGSD